VAPRQPRKKPSFDLIRHKVGDAHFFLQQLKRHRDRQRDAAKPPSEEFSYYLSAFLNGARSVGKLIERAMGRQKSKWWEKLSTADRALHDRFDEMRGSTVYDGEVETKRKTEKVPIRFEPNYDLQGQRVQGFFFQDMFGEVLTEAQTRSVDLDGVEREVVGLCEQYLDLLVREVEAVEKANRPAAVP
jgi:hypothetical protein